MLPICLYVDCPTVTFTFTFNAVRKDQVAFAYILTLKPLTLKVWWAPNNASRWQMGFNSAFKVLMLILGKKMFDASLEIIFYIRFEQTVILLVNTGSGLKSRMCLNFVNILCSFWLVLRRLNYPKRKRNIFRTRRKFEIKNISPLWGGNWKKHSTIC